MLRKHVTALLYRIHRGIFCGRQKRTVPMRTITVFCEVRRLSSKETAHKTILIDSAPLRVQHEKVSLTVKAPQKSDQIFLSPNASLHLTPNSESSQSQRLPPPQPPPKPSVDLRLLAETTHWLIDESKQSPGMQRVPPPEKNRESLADRLSKGIHDLTQGSSDRLQRWKTKLQNGNHTRRQKDQSEPPPLRRPPMRVMEVDSTMPEWSDRYPRPLHPSRSASNALQINHFVSGQSFGKEGMDHRTLKVRENSASQKDLSFHYHHMNSLQNIMNTLDGYTKNNFDCPPPRILPFSGVKPATDGLIRPVAFRPLASQNDDPAYPPGNDTRLERQVIRGDSTKSTTNISQLVSTQLQKSRVMFQPSTR
ncbi:hypothetical protein GCK32_014028 [Trichostrongylus colubriformis]|uniref:Uncharacterized protein n=1 Tax=Trichostrongylus colubriformis TaxID=6319 RepID=A0AAN8G822_TRICO